MTLPSLLDLEQRWRAEAAAIEDEDDASSMRRFGTLMSPDGYGEAIVQLIGCADELAAVREALEQKLTAIPHTWSPEFVSLNDLEAALGAKEPS